jgi:hypothetical protein
MGKEIGPSFSVEVYHHSQRGVASAGWAGRLKYTSGLEAGT